MKTRNVAPQQAADEGLLTFCDVAACFSEEEWTLLQNWQKELYRNVMTEIRQALSSLGPLIAASVFSLRPEEKEGVSFKFPEDSEGGGTIHPPSGEYGQYVPGPDDGLRTEEESEFGLMEPHDAEGDEGSAGDWFGRGYVTPVASLNIKREGQLYSMDKLHSEIKGIASARPEVTSPAAPIGIDEEGEMYAIDIQDHQRLGRFDCPAGDGSMDTKGEVDNSSNCKDKRIVRESTPEQLNSNMVPSVFETKNLIRTMWSGSNQEMKEEKTEEGHKGCSQQMYSTFHQTVPNMQRSDAYTKHEITFNHDNPNSCMHPEREQSRQKNRSTGHQRAHKAKERHTCTECGKSLRSASALLRHERVHTGERPFLCSICGKSYNQKEVLRRHQKMHTGEKPYQCGECGKSFALKHNLVGHQTTHTRRQRRYETGL